MKRLTQKIAWILLTAIVASSILSVPALAEEITDEKVTDVINQLESIDTLQEMQDKRNEYQANVGHYDLLTTDTAVITAHETARSEYEEYVKLMFAARLAAQQSYDELSAEQKAMIDPELVAKLNNELPTTLNLAGGNVTPADDEYTFEAVCVGDGYGYEISNHMAIADKASKKGDIPQTFILVDTADGKTSWTPSGEYVYGESNYEVTYCCDVKTLLIHGTDYKRVNLEDSNYYGPAAAKHIRAILTNSYPYVTLDEMKAYLKAGGLEAEFVDSLTRSDIIAAVQMAIWSYANAGDGATDGLTYFASVDITKNIGSYFTPLHDTNNECWDWLPKVAQRSYDARAAYRVNNLAYYLCNLPGIEAENDQVIINDVIITRAELIPGTKDTYNVGLYVYLNAASDEKDNLTITATSYSVNDEGNSIITGSNQQKVGSEESFGMFVKAKYGDTIQVVIEGKQHVAKGVYFYEPEGGRDVSQSLVGVGEGETAVYAEESFVFEEDIEKGLRIYKTDVNTGHPLKDMDFTVYKVVTEEGETVSTIPTAEEISKYATEVNKVKTITTDATGYAALPLDDGTYLVVEEENEDKVKAPVAPFYISIPMKQEITVETEGSTETKTEYVNIVSVYPKNDPKEEEEPPLPPPPTPDDVTGKFSILKHDKDNKNKVLEGAVFQVYVPVAEGDGDEETLICDGVRYVAEPVLLNGEPVILTTDENGKAISPELACGTYLLKETKAPNGYMLDSEATAVTVVSSVLETTETVVQIENQKQIMLPSTGGIGTTIFTVAGIAIMALAVGFFFMNRKKEKK